ncbi:MAG: FixH family protein [Hydrogenobacter thermophilus]|uniref:FixH family protein n=1 Tax=Hydrogenobacter thermophilus TaxID=940 RepID=UPI001C790DCB|nr:FixH family protein [Hydrogenobacter thermophilus]QWK19957.1 MAG: FixH family protein [Hydrogenobacter thermophilus]
MCRFKVLFIFLFGILALSSTSTAEYIAKSISEYKVYTGRLVFASKPKVGRNSALLYIFYTKSNNPVDKKLNLEIVPWMTEHEHGSTEIPKVSLGMKAGEYKITSLTFTMPGKWQIYVKVKDNNFEDTLVFDVTVAK